MEPMRHAEPENDFLKKVRKIADRIGAVLIFDEISMGFRLGYPGVHTRLGVTPDIAIYSKAIANGFPMAALVGKREVMKEAEASFISSTFHAERTGPVAALTTIRKMKKLKVIPYIDKMGWKIGKVWQKVGKKHRLPISVEGPGALIHFNLSHPEAVALKALYTQEMLDHGYLASSIIYVSYGHKDSHLPRFEKAVDKIFEFLAERIEKNDIMKHLKGGLPESGFARLT
jgi:glutamate-1-semialdehyde aminotransferase